MTQHQQHHQHLHSSRAESNTNTASTSHQNTDRILSTSASLSQQHQTGRPSLIRQDTLPNQRPTAIPLARSENLPNCHPDNSAILQQQKKNPESRIPTNRVRHAAAVSQENVKEAGFHRKLSLGQVSTTGVMKPQGDLAPHPGPLGNTGGLVPLAQLYPAGPASDAKASTHHRSKVTTTKTVVSYEKKVDT